MRDPVFFFELCHGHSCLVVPSHHLLLVWSNGLPTNDYISLPQ